MLKLGQYQKLTIVKKVEFGVYLAEEQDMEKRVLLPAKQVPENAKTGDELEVFLYKDSKDRMIATTNQPKITLGGLAVLRVAQVGKIGAFLDWGLEKDLFLPYKEMTMKVQPEDEVLVTLYIDKSSRLCASMKKLYDLLSTDSPYKEGDHVEGRVYEFSDNFGTFVAVDDKYSAMIPRHEATSKLRIGDVIEAKVTKVKPDGKLVELAAESWHIKPEELLMVGDTPNDMRFAHNGHAFAIGVLSGTGKIHHMECVADDLIESVAELPAWLEGKRGENNGRN